LRNGTIRKKDLVHGVRLGARRLRFITIFTSNTSAIPIATPTEELSTRPSLIVDKTQWEPVSWTVREEDRWGSHEFDPTRYPDPEGMVKELHKKFNTRIMISVWPKFYVGTKQYDEFKEQGFWYMRNVEKNQRDWVGPGYVSTFEVVWVGHENPVSLDLEAAPASVLLYDGKEITVRMTE
jgi:hypothetical protein